MKRTLFLLVTCALCLVTLSYAEEGRVLLVEQALDVSGFEKQIGQISEQMAAGIKDNPGKFPDDFFRKFSAIINESFRSNVLYDDIVGIFLDNFDQEKLSEVIELSKSPLAVKMTGFEIEAGSPNAAQQMVDFFNKIQLNPPAASRMDLIKELDSVTKSSEKVLEVSLAIISIFAKAREQLLPPEKRPSAEELELMLRQKREALTPALKEKTEQTFLYVYRNATDEELAEYIDFIKSDSIKWFNDIASASLITALTDASKRAAQGLVAIAKPAVVNQNIFDE